MPKELKKKTVEEFQVDQGDKSYTQEVLKKVIALKSLRRSFVD